MTNRLDIIVFGATGFTGKHTLPYIYKFSKNSGNNLSWGIAGRSAEKLNTILEETAKRIEVHNLSWVPIIIADTDNEDSIKQMTRQARVILNCCGPYQLHGEVVVKACIESGTHLIDISAEEQYTEAMVKKYDEDARAKGMYMIGACGVDCVPTDLGVTFLENNFNGTVNSVEVYVTFDYSCKPIVNAGTWNSFVAIARNPIKWFFLHFKTHSNLEIIPTLLPKLATRWCPFHRREDTNVWAVSFPGSDEKVIERSQRYFYTVDKKRPVQAKCYISISSFFKFLLVLFIILVTMVFAQCNCGRKLLIKYPEFFTAGYFTNKDPDEKVLKNATGTYTCYGLGWKEKLEDCPELLNSLPNKSMITTVGGKISAYDFTCIAFALGAIVLLTEQEKLPEMGGVYSTAAAFGKTSYIKQLQENGVNFEILSSKNI